MSDRDDLAALIDQYTPAFDNTHDDSVACADAIFTAGWRRSTVNDAPEQATQPAVKVPCPEGFHWVGQSFRHCAECGLPAWDHAGEARLPERVSTDFLFASADPGWVLKPWRPGERASCFRKWSEPGDTLSGAEDGAE